MIFSPKLNFFLNQCSKFTCCRMLRLNTDFVRPDVQGTCKYGTRVDYILASPDSPYKFVPGSYSVISSKGTSDHHIVKVDVTKVSENAFRLLQRPKQKVIRMTNPCSTVGVWKLNKKIA